MQGIDTLFLIPLSLGLWVFLSECLSGSIVFIILFVGLNKSLVGSFLTSAEQNHEREREEEERDPEGDDFAKEPRSAIGLSFSAKFTIFIEVCHVGECIHNQAEESVDRGHVPANLPVDSDKDDNEEKGSADPFNDVEDGDEQQRGVIHFRGSVRIVQLMGIGKILEVLWHAWVQSILVWVQINAGNGTNELCEIPETHRETKDKLSLV